MATRNELFPSRFLTAADLKGRPHGVVIEEVTREDVGGENKPVIRFRDRTKGLVLNVTNYDAIAKRHGNETDDWNGKAVTICPTKVDFKGKRVDAIRIADPSNDMDDGIPF